MKLKEQAVAEMSKEKEAQEQDSRREKEPLPAEAEVNETEFGEMDNFQTPLVRLVHLRRSFYVTDSNDLTCCGVHVFLQLSSLVPLVRLSLPSLRRRLMVLLA